MSVYIGAAYYPEMWDENEIDKETERFGFGKQRQKIIIQWS